LYPEKYNTFIKRKWLSVNPQAINKYFHGFNRVPWSKEDEANIFNFGRFNTKK